MSGGSVPFAIPWRRSLSRAKVPAEDPLDLAQLIYQQYPVVYGTMIGVTAVCGVDLNKRHESPIGLLGTPMACNAFRRIVPPNLSQSEATGFRNPSGRRNPASSRPRSRIRHEG
jgi:hypothetical protein